MPSESMHPDAQGRADAVDRGWLEVRCALFPEPTEQRRFVAWSALGEAIERWRAEGRFRLWFFVRKPPGIRLRFAGDDLAGRLEPALLPWLAESERRNDVRGFRFATYEPEQARFGGPVGMAIAHDAFDSDSRDAVRYETLEKDAGHGVSRAEFSVAACGHLFRRCLGDRAEVWDVWQRLRRVVENHAQVTPMGMHAERIEALAGGTHPDLADLGPAVRRLLEQRFDDNLRVAEKIVAAHDAGRLEVGLRSWLAALTLFHWNRFGLGLAVDDVAVLVSDICRVLEPDV